MDRKVEKNPADMTKNLKRNFLTFFSINSLFGMVGTLIFGGLVMRFGSKRVMMLLTVPVFLCWVNGHSNLYKLWFSLIEFLFVWYTFFSKCVVFYVCVLRCAIRCQCVRQGLIYFGDSYYYILASRVCTGLTAGGVQSTIILYISEISSNHIRGRLASFSQLSRNFGVLIRWSILTIFCPRLYYCQHFQS